MRVTDSGLKYSVIGDIGELGGSGALDAYDRTVAQTHISNYGVIFVGEFGDILDNEYELEEVYEDWSKGGGRR